VVCIERTLNPWTSPPDLTSARNTPLSACALGQKPYSHLPGKLEYLETLGSGYRIQGPTSFRRFIRAAADCGRVRVENQRRSAQKLSVSLADGRATLRYSCVFGPGEFEIPLPKSLLRPMKRWARSAFIRSRKGGKSILLSEMENLTDGKTADRDNRGATCEHAEVAASLTPVYPKRLNRSHQRPNRR